MTWFGAVPPGQALRRDGARSGDDIWVSGELGAADVAYRLLDGQYPANAALLAATRGALEWPEPQVGLGTALRGIANAAIDLSDGLVQDLGHILAASRVGARLRFADLPMAPALASLEAALLQRALLGGGDVYQLCFTAPPSRRDAVLAAARTAGARVTRVGEILPQPGIAVLDAQGQPLADLPAGFDHFPAD